MEVACTHRNNYGSSTSSGAARTSSQSQKTRTRNLKSPEADKTRDPSQNLSSESSPKEVDNSKIQPRRTEKEDSKKEPNDPEVDTSRIGGQPRDTREVSGDMMSENIGFLKFLNISAAGRGAESVITGKEGIHGDDRVSLEYMLLPSYHEMLKRLVSKTGFLHRSEAELSATCDNKYL